MITLTDNWIIVEKDDCTAVGLKSILIKQQPSKTVRLKNGKKVRTKPKVFKYYTESEDGNIYIPIGLLFFIEDDIKVTVIKDERVKIDFIPHIQDIDELKHILPGIELREEQAIAIRKAVAIRRGILQLPTGSGKTEILCGIVKELEYIFGKVPTTIILEPTINLVNSTVKRFQKYGLTATSYTKTREIRENSVNICHPSSLGNDIDKNPDLLKGVTVLLGDESHHFNSEQFRKPTYNMPNLILSIGVSASVILQEHIGFRDIRDYDIKEVLAFSATGPLLMNVVTSDMIDSNRLATPALFRMKHNADEEIPNNDSSNWHNVEKIRLESDSRNELIVKCSQFFVKNDRKVLILVNTIRWSRLLLTKFSEFGMESVVGASYGSGKFEKFLNQNFINDDNILNDFETGKIKVLIGTTHLYEGADIHNLDVIILGFGGNGERTQIQGVGRALRRTKNGKYAYIVDFTDDFDSVLKKHSANRLNRYQQIFGIPSERIFDRIQVEDLETCFNILENNE